MNHTDPSSTPLVSVMMPARNAAAHLEATVRSIQAQTYQNWELVFVDDGSQDDTLKVINRLAAGDPRIRVFPMAHGGRGRARNACIERARGEFVAVCDADDVSFPHRFEKQVAFLKANPSIGGVGSWWVPFAGEAPGGPVPIREFPTTPEDIRRAFARKKMRFHNATVMLRASLFRDHGAYDVELRRAQDYEFFSRLSRRGVQFAAIPEPLLYYRQEADIPSIQYFRENGMFMAYADRVLSGHGRGFDQFAQSLLGRLWRIYYTVKFGYFYLKLFAMQRMGR